MINEDELFEIIKTKPGKKSKYEIAAEEEAKEEIKKAKKVKKEKSKTEIQKKEPEVKKELSETKVQEKEPIKVKKTASQTSVGSLPEKVSKVVIEESKPNLTPPELWVEKYKPKNLGKIVGQNGGASCAKKLLNWLRDWEKNQGVPKDQRPKPKWTGAKLDDPTGASLRAALLSGPPGVGKTTSAIMVAQELGMDVIEFNASGKYQTKDKNLCHYKCSILRFEKILGRKKV